MGHYKSSEKGHLFSTILLRSLFKGALFESRKKDCRSQENRFGFSRTKQGAFKTQFLIELKKRFPNIKGGIGNRPHDALAYLSAGVQPWIIRAKEEPSKFAKETRFVTQWQEVSKALTE